LKKFYNRLLSFPYIYEKKSKKAFIPIDTTPKTPYSLAINMQYMPREEGQGLVEYALILVLVAVVVIVILALLGPAIGNIFSNIVRNL
jgi:pilus assembly protein Flp/PilA